MSKALTASIALLTAAVLQVSLAPHIAVFGVVPNFFFLVVVTLAFIHGPVTGGVTGFVGGLLFDLIGTSVVGPYALVLSVVGYATGMLSANLFAEGWLLPVTIVAVASLSAELANGIVLARSRHGHDPVGRLPHRARRTRVSMVGSRIAG
jgi:rod shape-determining protein MreD